MAAYVGLNNRIYYGHLDLSGLADQVDFGPLIRAFQPCPTFNDAGFDVVAPGLISGEGRVSGFQDWAADVLDDEISIGQLGSAYPFTVVGNPTGTVTAGDPCYMSRGLVRSLTPFSGAAGDIARFTLGQRFDTAIPRSLVAHPSAARTATGNGTTLALTGPTASQKLYCALHVTAYSGLTSLVVTVQSDDNSGMSSATTRLTMATVTGTTSEWKSVAGNFSTETHHRIVYTIVGTGSVTFAAAFGVL